jgi:hypothetical protein
MSRRRSLGEARRTAGHDGVVGARGKRRRRSGLRNALTRTYPRLLPFLAARHLHSDHRRPRAASRWVRLDEPQSLLEWSGLAANGRGGRGRKVTPLSIPN